MFGNAVDKVTVVFFGFPVNDEFTTDPAFVARPPPPAFKANEAVVANEAVPNNDPVNPPFITETDPVTPRLPVICADPEKGNAAPAPPGMFIDAVFANTVAVTPAPIKSKKVAVP